VSHDPLGAEEMRFVLLAAVILVAGCDYLHGVSRYTGEIPIAPPSKCVEEAISSVDGVTNVSYSLEEGGRPLTLHGIQQSDQVHRFWYEYKGIKSNVYFISHYNGTADYHHSYGCINCTPPQEVIDRLYPGMRAIDQAVTSHCGLAVPIHERCSGVRCGGA
jgi:copper chaperone CopZ